MGGDQCPVAHHDPPQALTLVVPPGVVPGEIMKFDGPDGALLEVLVPEGKGTGQPFQVQLPWAVTVSVPMDRRAGEIMEFDAPDGTRMQVQVPEGKVPGDHFEVQLVHTKIPARGQARVIVPEGALPGQLVEFNRADGMRMQVPVPEGKQPGDHFQVYLAPAVAGSEVALIVPMGASPGQLVSFEAPDGMRMQTAVPEGKIPGDTFHVRLGPPPGQVAVTVPVGARAGDEVAFAAPDGTQLKSVVPEGLAPGETFCASLSSREEFVLGQLYTAAGCGDVEAAKRWMAEGAPINGVVDMGFTPLFYAATNGRIAMTQWLLEHHANVEVRCVGQRTALHWAARNGHLDVVRLLVAVGAPLHAKDRSDKSPLAIAVDKGQIAVAQFLHAAGACS